VTGLDATNALASLPAIDAALTNVSTRRAEFGGAMNRLAVSIANTQTIRNNLAAANSAIQDVDVAAETSRLASSQVLLQAGTAILAQANQSPQLALQLLK
jgi:flagellin